MFIVDATLNPADFCQFFKRKARFRLHVLTSAIYFCAKVALKMRKVFAFAAVAGLLSLASCGEKKTESSTVDSTAVTTVDTAAMEAPADTTALAPAADSTVVVDTTHKM